MSAFIDAWRQGGLDRRAEEQYNQQQAERETEQKEKKLQRLSAMMDYFDQIPEERKAAAYPQLVKQGISEGLFTPDVPQVYGPEVAAQIEPVRMQLAAYRNQANTPSGYREFELMAGAAGAKGEDRAKAARINLGLDPRQSSAAIQYKEVVGPDGRPVLVAVDPRGVGAQTIGGGPSYGTFAGQEPPPKAQPPQPQPGVPPPGNASNVTEVANQMVAAGIPREFIEKWMQSQPGIGPPPSAGPAAAAPPQAAPPQPGVNPFAGRTPEEQAALTKRAEIDAGLDRAPQVTQMEADRAAAIEAARGGAQAEVERDKVARMNQSAFASYQQAMGALGIAMEDTSTGYLVGRMPAFTAEQQIADGAIAALAPILKNLFRSAGEGVFTDKDQDLLMKMVPTRLDLPRARAAKIANINAIVAAKLNAAGQSGQAPPANAGAEKRTRIQL